MSNHEYEAPKTEESPVVSSNDIDSLNVSASWKKKFKLIEKAGGVKLPRFKELTFGERFSLNFNVLAFFFTMIYLFVKGMWKQGLIILGIWCVLVLIISIFYPYIPKHMGTPIGIAWGYFVAIRSNICYYRIKVLKEDGWFI